MATAPSLPADLRPAVLVLVLEAGPDLNSPEPAGPAETSASISSQQQRLKPASLMLSSLSAFIISTLATRKQRPGLPAATGRKKQPSKQLKTLKSVSKSRSLVTKTGQNEGFIRTNSTDLNSLPRTLFFDVSWGPVLVQDRRRGNSWFPELLQSHFII